MLNVVAIMGRLVADPELRTTTQGINVCSFRIACDRNFARQGEQRQADFIDIVAWRQQAEFVSKYFQKGSLIAIEGSLQSRPTRTQRLPVRPPWRQLPAILPVMQTTSPLLTTAMICRSDTKRSIR